MYTSGTVYCWTGHANTSKVTTSLTEVGTGSYICPSPPTYIYPPSHKTVVSRHIHLWELYILYPLASSLNNSSSFPKCLQTALVSCHPQGTRSQAHLSLALADPEHTNWSLCPSLPAAILFTILFALTTCAHLSQAVFYKKIYCWVIVGSGLAQTVNCILRIVSIKNPNSLGPYAAWFVLILASRYQADPVVKR